MRAPAIAASLLAMVGCSGSWWTGHVHGTDGGVAAPAYPPAEKLDGGTAVPPPVVGGWVPVPGGGEEPTNECSADEDCPVVDCACEDGSGFTAQFCDEGWCAVADDCPYMCGDVSPDQ